MNPNSTGTRMTRNWMAAAPRSRAGAAGAGKTGRRGHRPRTRGAALRLFGNLMAAWSYELRFLLFLLRGLFLAVLVGLLLGYGRQERHHRIGKSRLLSGS